MSYFYIKDYKVVAQSTVATDYKCDFDFIIVEKYIGDAIDDFGKSRGKKRFTWNLYNKFGEPYYLNINNFIFPSYYISFFMNPKNLPFYGDKFIWDCLIPIDFTHEGQQKKIYINQGINNLLAFFIFIDKLPGFTPSEYLQLYLDKNEAISETIKLKYKIEQLNK